jgi:NAD(P)-dependent dehydrogenase (short-subunit alcohol dehydrogenase family)
MASVAGLIGFAGSGAYVASKHGVIGLTKTAALEYSKHGVRINAISPGVIMTPMIDRVSATSSGVLEALEAMHPIGRTGSPEEVADAVLWLCSREASFITGVALPIDGGYVAQ